MFSFVMKAFETFKLPKDSPAGIVSKQSEKLEDVSPKMFKSQNK
jgi:hypothetical protein